MLHEYRFRLSGWLAIALLLFFFSASVRAQEGLPPWFQDNLKRETKLEKMQSFETKDKTMRGKVLAKGVSPPELDGEDHYLDLDIGAGQMAGCFLFSGDIDLAGSLTSMLDNMIELQASRVGELLGKQVMQLDAGAIGASPFLALEWLYVVGDDLATQIGTVKGRIARKNGRGVYCAHNEVGYRETFERTFASLVRELDSPKEAPEPSYVEIHRVLINGQPISVDAVYVYPKGSDERVRYLEQGATLLPLDASTLQVSDEQTEGLAAADGTTLEELALEVVNGEMVANLRLVRAGEKGYSVSGEYKGELFETQLERGPTSAVQEFEDFRKLASDKEAARLSHWEWDAGDAPDEVMAGSLVVTSRSDESVNAALTLMGQTMQTVLDQRGSLVRAEGQMGEDGEVRVQIERVFVSAGRE